MVNHWYKRSCDFWLDTKVIEAGLDGGLVFDAILAINAQGDRDGFLTPSEVAPRALRARLAGAERSIKQVEYGLRRCFEVGLLRDDEDGVRIVGWGPRWKPSTSTPRVQKHRAEKRVGCVPQTPNNPNGGRRRNVSETQTKRSNSVSETHRQDKTRGEESTPQGPPAEPGAAASGNPPPPCLGASPQPPSGGACAGSPEPEPEARAQGHRNGIHVPVLTEPQIAELDGIVHVLVIAGWGNSDRQRRAKAKELAHSNGTADDLRAVLAYANREGRRPTQLFAHLLKSPAMWRHVADECAKREAAQPQRRTNRTESITEILRELNL